MPADQAGEGLEQDGSHPPGPVCAGNSVTFLEPPQRVRTQLGPQAMSGSSPFEAITHIPGISLGNAGSPPVDPGPLCQGSGSQATHWDPGPCGPLPQADGPTGAWPWLTSGRSICRTEGRDRDVPHCASAGAPPFQSSAGSSVHNPGTCRASLLCGCARGAAGRRRGQRHGHSPRRGRGSRRCGPAGVGRGPSFG